MNPHQENTVFPSRSLYAAAVMTLVVLTGCGSNRETAQSAVDTPAVESTPPPQTAGPSWLAEVRQHEAELGGSVEQGRLSEVHDHAEKISALLKQAADPSSGLTEDQRLQIRPHLDAAGRLTDELHHAGDAGDLTLTRTKFQEFQTHLRAIEGVFGITQP